MEVFLDTIEKIAEVYKALSDPTRLKLVRLLTESNFLCVNALTKKLGVSQSAVSQHLRVLRQAGLVQFERRGYHVHYALDQTAMKQFQAMVKETFGESFTNT